MWSWSGLIPLPYAAYGKCRTVSWYSCYRRYLLKPAPAEFRWDGIQEYQNGWSAQSAIKYLLSLTYLPHSAGFPPASAGSVRQKNPRVFYPPDNWSSYYRALSHSEQLPRHHREILLRDPEYRRYPAHPLPSLLPGDCATYAPAYWSAVFPLIHQCRNRRET